MSNVLQKLAGRLPDAQRPLVSYPKTFPPQMRRTPYRALGFSNAIQAPQYQNTYADPTGNVYLGSCFWRYLGYDLPGAPCATTVLAYRFRDPILGWLEARIGLRREDTADQNPCPDANLRIGPNDTTLLRSGASYPGPSIIVGITQFTNINALISSIMMLFAMSLDGMGGDSSKWRVGTFIWDTQTYRALVHDPSPYSDGWPGIDGQPGWFVAGSLVWEPDGETPGVFVPRFVGDAYVQGYDDEPGTGHNGTDQWYLALAQIHGDAVEYHDQPALIGELRSCVRVGPLPLPRSAYPDPGVPT